MLLLHLDNFESLILRKSAQQRGISRPQFLNEHKEPSHYRPELASSNRSHRGEDMINTYFGS
ncbi:HNH/ENDO VII family nuclease [Acinetobacter gyllenbergii]|uniref:GH-E family nuclease n=1 Tax=Acinetobacter gyllenbergii TaxID=134534 RepID=UPI0037094827|nr:HNH/ENDO VII family nuclease [Acinetobacter gyllenbergii]